MTTHCAPLTTNGHNAISSPEVQQHHDIVAVSVSILQQSIDLLQSLPSDAEFTTESNMVPKSTIGKHVRHIFEHFRLLFADQPNFLNSITNKNEEIKGNLWIVNYDKRERDAAMEQSRNVAIQNLREMQSTLKALSPNNVPLDASIRVDAITDPNVKDTMPFSSTFGRELWWVCHHAIHHYALIKVICIECGIPTSENFGIAPSTLKGYREHEHS